VVYVGHLGFVLALSTTPCPHHGRRERGQLGLDRGPEGVGEPLRRLHDNVDEVAAADPARHRTPA
jgi:hypothetical protein